MFAACATSGGYAVDRPAHAEPSLVASRHTVGPGQNLYRIALAYGLSQEELARANRIQDPTRLAVGQVLIIPGANRSRPIDVSPRDRDTPSVPSPAQRAADTAATTIPAAPRIEQTRSKGVLDWPLRGVLYARFGKKGKEPHDGVDLAAPLGTPVKTAAPGTVLYAGEQTGYGLIVIVEHADRLVTLYAHNRDLRVKTGQRVRAGQVIATVGESGRTSGPHLHFEVRRGGVPVDPLSLLGAPPAT